MSSIDLNDYPYLAGRLVCSPEDAMRALDCGRAKLYELINGDQLDSYVDGRSRKITVASVIGLVNRRLEAARAKKAA